jgi:putative membrane protein
MTAKHMFSRICLYSASALLAGGLAVAQSPQQPTPGQSQPNAPNQQQPTNPNTVSPPGATEDQSMFDQEFLRKALEGGAAEVQLGQLAQQKSQSGDVKQFGQKMVADHTQLGDAIKPIAQKLGVKQPKEPSKKDRQLIAKLETLSGPEFDQAYIQAMLKDHQQDLKEFKNEAQSAQDPNIKRVAQVGANVISQHLQLIQQIAQSHNVTASNRSM